MRPRIHFLVIVLGSAFLAGCAARTAVLFPAPPVGIPKSTQAESKAHSPAPLPAGPLPAPGPDYGRMYRDAVARTREMLAKGEGRSAIPFWVALESSPFVADAVFNQGVLLHLSGDIGGAEALYRRAVAPPLLSEPAATNLLGIALLREDREMMRALADNVVQPVAALSGDRLPEFSANLVALLIDLSRFEEADTLARSLTERKITPPTLPWSRAVLSYRTGDLVAARRFSSLLSPPVAGLWPVVASRIAWERETAKVPPLDERVSGEPRYRLLSRNLAAYDAWRKGDLAGSEALLSAGASMKSPPGEYLNNFGIVLAEEGRWKEATAFLERTVAEAPGLPEGWLNLGIFREVYLGDAPGALSCYERYVTLEGSRRNEVFKWVEWLKKSSLQR